MNVISPKLKFVMKIVFKPITTSALLSDDQKMPTLDSFWYMTSHIVEGGDSLCTQLTDMFFKVYTDATVYLFNSFSTRNHISVIFKRYFMGFRIIIIILMPTSD